MLNKLRKILATLLIFAQVSLLMPSIAWAQQGKVLGIHILHPEELEKAKSLIGQEESSEDWHYVTIPFSLDDLKKQDQWQAFFNQARDSKIIPLVRLVTRFENGAWQRPERKDIVDQISVLTKLNWPTNQRHIIIFNEVNHAKEWGGQVDPVSYVETFKFASNWAHSEAKNFVVLPAAMDLAAPNGSQTMEAFTYLDSMYAEDEGIFEYADAWNSHSYPNPGFSSSPQRTGKNSLRGFEHELAYLKKKTDRDYLVYITETGWQSNGSTLPWLESYYTYALQHIWSNPQVVAVTPFVLQGSPGPFSGFSFLTETGDPTTHYQALKRAVESVGI